MRTWTLPEREDVRIDKFDPEIAELLVREFDDMVEVTYPSPKTDGQWKLRNRGYAGQIPLPGERAIVLQPKAHRNGSDDQESIVDVLAMMEYAYKLGEFHTDELFEATSIAEFYDKLAHILARSVISRRKRGLFRSYESRSEWSETIRGRVNVRRTAAAPWKRPAAYIKYSELTVDNEDNRILLHTLSRIASSRNALRSETQQRIQQAIRLLRGAVSREEFSASDCTGRTYTRLNQDYERLHVLCRLLLDSTGPSYSIGDDSIVPFRVDMDQLYQRFVTRWLREHLHGNIQIRDERQRTIASFPSRDIGYRIDIVIEDSNTGETICVIDTKHKLADRPATDDISQLVGYAQAERTQQAFLVYPAPLDAELDTKDALSGVRVRSLVFPVKMDPDSGGRSFISQLETAIGRDLVSTCSVAARDRSR